MTRKRIPTFTLILVFLPSIWLVACKPVEPGATFFEFGDPETVTLPVERELTDTDGRTIRARIVGKDAFGLDIVRLSDAATFKLPFAKLSDEDRVFADRIAVTSASSSASSSHPYIANREKTIKELEKEISALLIQITPMERTLTRGRLVRDVKDRRAEISQLKNDIAQYKIDRGL